MKPEDFGIAVIGCGRWGQNHVRTANKVFGKSLRFICDAHDPNLRKASELAPGAKAVATLDPILEDREVSGVIIATPAETHYAVAKRCLEAGKHVLVEKPLALDPAHAHELTALAEKKGRVLMVGHVLLFHPAVRKAKELIDAGRLGKLQYVYSNRLSLGAVRKEENVWWSFAPHDVAMLQYLVGSEPNHVSAGGAAILQPKIEDAVTARLSFPNGVKGHVFVSWLHPFKEHRLTIIGDRAMLVFEDSKADKKLMLYPKGFDRANGEFTKRDGEPEVIEFAPGEPLALEQQHFAECAASGRPSIADGKHGAQVLEVLAKAQKQIEKGE